LSVVIETAPSAAHEHAADRRPPTADRRPPTADRRPPTADRRDDWSETG
jgi:hypothetical protein